MDEATRALATGREPGSKTTDAGSATLQEALAAKP